MRILVVEDNLINQQVAQELLSGEGALVEVADNGQLGVTAVARAQPPYDAVLMDIQMPVMDGYTATQVIRRELRLADMPIIAMTANAMKSDRDACLASGMNDHVGKPFDLPHLVQVLLTHTKRVAPGSSASGVLPQMVVEAASAKLPPEDALDVAGAIARMGGKSSTYARILGSYLAQLQLAPDTLDALLAQGDRAQAAALLHTIKGLSGTVGATHMAAVSKLVETQVNIAPEPFAHDALRALFRSAVAACSPRLEQIATEYAQPVQGKDLAPPTQALNAQALVADLHALHKLLENSDMGALQAHSHLRATHLGTIGGEFARLEEAISKLDFANAMLHCTALIEKFSA
jgi:CheY-like chemotaxis protein